MTDRETARETALWRAAEGDVADKIARAAYGSERGGATEALLDANPGLADLGPILPIGTMVRLPAPPEARPVRPVRLWS